MQRPSNENAQQSHKHLPVSGGTGYNTENGNDMRPLYFMPSYWQRSTNFRQKDEQTDRIRTQILQLLPAFLPVSTTRSRPELYAMCRLSLLIGYLLALIRNDDVTNMTKRSGLYPAALSFLATAAKYSTVVNILLKLQPAKKQSPGLHALGEGANRKPLIVDRSSTVLAPSLLFCG
jgi:hypothetical protein